MKKKNNLHILLLLVIFWGGLNTSVFAQTIYPDMFGINYWYYQSESGMDAFMNHREELQKAGLRMVRIGGNYANNERDNENDRDWYLGQINRIKEMGATPLVQLPIHLNPSEVVEWYEWFNETHDAGVVYWAIGNEPDPSKPEDAKAWFEGSYQHDGYHYTWFRGKFRENARALKDRAPNSIIVGPSFRHFWQGGTYCPLRSYYEDFITDIGTSYANNGLPILDVFSFNRYGVRDETSTRAVFDLLMDHINTVNNSRPVNHKLTFGITECNANRGEYTSIYPWYFRAGQYIALLSKLTMENGGRFVIPWSVFESGGSQNPTDYDFSLFNADDTKRSTMWHLELMNRNLRRNYLELTQSSQINNIVAFGMHDETGYSILVMNYTNYESFSFRVKLNDESINSSEQVKINFSGGHNTEMSGVIEGRSTHIYRFSSNGDLLQRVMCSLGDSEPMVTNYSPDPLSLNDHHLQNVWTSDFMRPYDGLKAENTGIVQYENPDTNWSSIEWSFEPAAVSGYYYIRNKWTDLVLCIPEESIEENLEVVQVDLTGKENWSRTMWQLIDAGNGDVWIRNRYSNKYIRPMNGNDGTNVPIVQNSLNEGYSSFKWQIVNSGGLKSATGDSFSDINEGNNTLKIFPNPVSDNLNIYLPDGEVYNSLELIDLKGNVVISQVFVSEKDSSVKVDLTGLSRGIYVLVLGGEKPFSQKVFVK